MPVPYRPAAYALLAVFVAYVALLFTDNFAGRWGEDLAALYIAGWLIDQGQDGLVYAHAAGFFGGTPPQWERLAQDLGAGKYASFPYLYPPIWAELSAPLTRYLSPMPLFILFGLLHAALAGACLVLAERIARPAAMGRTLFLLLGVAALLATVPLQIAAILNQPTLITSALTLLAFERMLARKPHAAGAALAVAAAIKLTPAAFALIFLYRRDWRALIAFAGVGAVLGLACLALSPALSLEFLRLLPQVSEHSTITRVNASLVPALYAVLSSLGMLPAYAPEVIARLLGPEVGRVIPEWMPLLAKLCALMTLALGANALRPASDALKTRGAILILSLVLPLFGPLGWLHYYLIPLLFFPLLAPAFSKPMGAALWLIAIALNSPQIPALIAPISELVDHYVIYITALWLGILALSLRALHIMARRGL